MNINVIKETLNLNDLGQDMVRLVSKLYPICRSITGNGFRETLNIIKEQIPLKVYEIPTGTKVFDWTVPKEWNIKDAYVKNSAGDRVIDFKKSNLHVVSYSMPVRKRVSWNELKGHLFTLPEYPDWISYRTSYYKEDWGFCLSHNQFLALKDEAYEVCIDSSLEEGHLTYGEFCLPGETEEEILISCHACHPSLCNDNLSGIALAVFLAKSLSSLSLRYTYRFLFIPGTIGSITWLALNEKAASRIKHGLVVACVGDPGKTTYKKSRQGDAEIDQAVIHVLKESGEEFEAIDFSPYGYDERQYCSPGFNLPVGCLMRTPHARYPEYHTSADNLDLVRQEHLENSFIKYLNTFCLLEGNRKYINTNAKCEPQLGRRGLYDATGGRNESVVNQIAVLWVLNLSDGRNSLLDIAERSHVEFSAIREAADALVRHQLLVEWLP
jgi:aminopeptidase-like protein